MPSVHLRGLSLAHTSATVIFHHVDLDVARDDASHPTPWVGVVGANGVGKSTLLRLLAGELTPTAGRLQIQASLPPRLVEQDVDALSSDVRSFAWAWDGVAQRLRRRLELDTDDLDDAIGRGWNALSPGLRKRWQVGAALAAEPDILLLDEPTNHLDAPTRMLLLEVLGDFAGLGFVVSHDRDVLERLTCRTLRLHRGTVELHVGAYGQASDRWRAAEGAERDAHEQATQQVRRERRLLADARRDRHSAAAGPRRERRLAGASEPDAREAGRKFVQRRAEAALAARVTQINARLDRAERAEQAFDIERAPGGRIGFRHLGTGRRVLFAVTADVHHGGGRVLLHDVDVALHGGERVHVTGANGAGKTTLLSACLAALDGTAEVVAVLPQDLEDPNAELDRVRELDPAFRGRVLGALATLGVDPERVLATDRPSPGEARKLALARMLVGDASVLVLDEPTNHLDLASIEHLERALITWSGALLLVTHDATLAAACTTSRWDVADGHVTVTRGAGSGPPTEPSRAER